MFNNNQYDKKGAYIMKKKSNVEYMKKKRASWAINPITRIKDDKTKNKKIRRQNEKKIIRNGY